MANTKRTNEERKNRSIYMSRKLHADKLAAKAEVAHDLAPIEDDYREYTEAELDMMLTAWCASISMESGFSPEAWF